MKDEIKKLYYSIGEVSRIAGLEQHVLRYWETEFDELQPRKNRSGNRIYTERDLRLVLRIRELLRTEKYTLEGARQALRRETREEGGDVRRHQVLRELRSFLEELRENLT